MTHDVDLAAICVCAQCSGAYPEWRQVRTNLGLVTWRQGALLAGRTELDFCSSGCALRYELIYPSPRPRLELVGEDHWVVRMPSVAFPQPIEHDRDGTSASHGNSPRTQ